MIYNDNIEDDNDNDYKYLVKRRFKIKLLTALSANVFVVFTNQPKRFGVFVEMGSVQLTMSQESL